MTDFVVRCPNCTQGSRVPFEARGLTVECPRCGLHFPALPETAAKPRNPAPVFVPPPPVVVEEPAEHAHEHHAPAPHGLLIAVALIPLGIPLLWLTASAIAGKQSIFSFVAPVALALGAGGLCAGLGSVYLWSVATRIRAMLAVVILGYVIGGVLYFTKPGWIEVSRRLFQGFNGMGGSTEYRPKDKSYSVRFPGKPTVDGESPIKAWRFNEVVTFSDPRRTGPEVFTSAHGFGPIDAPFDNEKFYSAAKDELLNSTGGKLVSEKPVPQGETMVREYEILLPDGVTKRVVRIARASTNVFYLSVEGPFLTPDLPQVREFLRSFKLLKK